MEYIQVLLPSVGIGVIFWLVLRFILHADRSERKAAAAAAAKANRKNERTEPEKQRSNH